MILGGSGCDAQRLDAFGVHQRRHFDHHIVGDAGQRALVRDVDLGKVRVVVDQPVDDWHLLLAGLFAAKRLDQAGLGIVCQPRHLGDALFEIFDEVRPRQLGVRAAPRLAKPMLFGGQIGVVPPVAALARRVADRHQAEHAVHVDRPARHLDVVRALGDVRAPVFLAIGRDPRFQQRIGVFAFVQKVREPDVVVQAGRLPVDLGRVEPQHARDLIHAVVAVAQAADLDARLAGHQRAAFVDRVARLDQPGVGADALDVLRHAEHKRKLPAPVDVDAAVVVAVFGG